MVKISIDLGNIPIPDQNELLDNIHSQGLSIDGFIKDHDTLHSIIDLLIKKRARFEYLPLSRYSSKLIVLKIK